MREIEEQMRSRRETGHPPSLNQQQQQHRKTLHSFWLMWCPLSTFPKKTQRKGTGSLLDFSLPCPLPWAIMLSLTWLVLIQINLTMHPNGYHVNLHKPHKNVLVQIPLTPPAKQNLFKAENCSGALCKQVVPEWIWFCIYKLKIRCRFIQ